MKKTVSSLFSLIVLPVLVLCFACLSVLCLIVDILNIQEKAPYGKGFLWCGIFLAVAYLFFWYLNRMACFVWIEDGLVKRKGLFYGFCKECKIESLQSVTIFRLWREGDFICFIDDSRHRFDRCRKDSYICVKKTKRNMAAVQSVWNKPIENRGMGI